VPLSGASWRLCTWWRRPVDVSLDYRVAFRKKVYRSIDELQTDLDLWIRDYNRASEHPSVYVIEEKRLC
jgi:hypothetical protein